MRALNTVTHMENLTPIEPITSQGVMNPEDVTKTLLGLAGTYATRDLYRRYRDLVKAQGQMPGSIQGFTRELTRRGYQNRRLSKNGKKTNCWFV